MNKWLFAMVAVFAIVGCKGKDEPVAGGSVQDVDRGDAAGVVVRFNVLGLDVSMVEMSPVRRGDGVDAGEAGMTDLWVLDGDSLVCHQVSGDAAFGSPEIALSQGAHSLTFIASSKEGQQVVGGVWSANSVSATYGSVLAVDVQPNMAAQSVVLKHVNYMIQWYSQDVIVQVVKKVELRIMGRFASLGSGLVGCGVMPEYVYTLDVSGQTGQHLNFGVSGFCVAMGVTDSVVTSMTAYDIEDKVVYRHEKKVPVKSNRYTVVTGNMFGSTKQYIIVDTDWEVDHVEEL